MLNRNRLLRLFLRNFIRFARDERDELDAAFDEKLAGVAGEGHGAIVLGEEGGGGEDFRDDFLDGGCGFEE